MTPDQAYERLLDVSGALFLLVILAMLLERALALVFEYHWFQELSNRWEGLKTPIAFGASWFICNYIKFDILSQLFPLGGSEPRPESIGILITAAIVAGGSAGAIMLFQGVFNFSREARTSLIEAKKVSAEADLAEAKARKDKAESEAAEAIVKKEKAETETAMLKNTRYSPGLPIGDDIDGCSIGQIEHATSDENLPAAEGGVLRL